MALVIPSLKQLLIEGSFRTAAKVFEAEWSAGKMNIGPDAPETVRNQVRYADVLSMAGDHDEAVMMYRDILTKMERNPQLFTDEVLDVKLSLANIIYRKDLNEATLLTEGVEELVTGMPMDGTKIALKKKLSTMMRDLGRYESALAYFDEIYKFKCIGDRHDLDCLSSHVDIATVYLEQGRYTKAMDILMIIHEEAKNIQPNHPCTLKAERYIADVCMHHGMTAIACSKYEHIAQIQTAENPKSLDTLTTLHKLSLAYLKDGRPKIALEVIEGVYNTRKVETPWHPDTKRVEIDLMMMKLREGEIAKAAFLLFGALESKSDCFDFELVVDIPRNIAMFFREQKKTEEAVKIYEYLYQRQCQMTRLGPLHPESLLTRTQIAETYLSYNEAEKIEEALKIFEDVLNNQINVLKNDSMDCLNVQKHIAALYHLRNEFNKSFHHYCEVYKNERMYLGPFHDVTIATENEVFGFCLIQPTSNLIRAIAENNYDNVINICNASENIDIDAQDDYGCTPLHAAAIAGRPEIVRFLLRKGASLFVKTKYGKFPFEVVKINDVKSIFDMIFKLFTDMRLENRNDIFDVLSNEHKNVREIMRDIINVLDEEGKTMLHRACEKGDMEMVNLLLNKGADPTVKDKSGRSALELATHLNQADIIQTINRHVEERRL